MRLLLATPLLPPDIGGPATFAKSLLTHLPSRGIELKVAYFGRVRRLPPGIRHFVYFLMLWRDVAFCDAIVALDPVSVGFPAAIVSRLRAKPLILRVAGDFAWEQGMNRFGVTELLDEFVTKKPTHPIVRLFNFIERFVARTAVRIIVPSAYFKKIITKWGIPAKKIEVILSAVEDMKLPGRRDVLRGILQFDGVFILSAGRLVPWKGYETLISLVPQLKKKFPQIKLMIVGDGPLRNALEARVEQEGLADAVVLAGALPREILLRYLKAADVFVLNTGYEGLSHQLLEVLAVGIPIVTTNVGGNPEIIEDGKNGLLVPYDNSKALETAISKVLSNKELATRLTAEGRKTLRKFSETLMIEHVERLLKKTV